MKNILKSISLLSLTALLLIVASCDSFLTIEDPEDKTITEGYYNSTQRVEQAVIGIYVDFRRALLSNRAWLMYGEARSGDLKVHATYYDLVVKQELMAEQAEIERLKDWEYFYDVLNNANEVLQIIDEVDPGVLTGYEYNLFKGEALALKSFAYFYLARIWGNVPSVEANNFETVLSAKETIVKAQELAQEANDLLPWVLLNEDGIESASLTEFRMNKTAIAILRAQEYLWLDNAQQAYRVLGTAILENTEEKWSPFGFSTGEDYRSDITDDPLDADLVSISLEKLNAIYPESDTRRAAYDISEKNGTASLLSHAQDVTKLLTKTNFYLLMAEAAWKIGNLEEAKATLIAVAQGATEDYSTLDENTFEQALLQERQRLLMGSGMRFFDLMRFNKVAEEIPSLSEQNVTEGAAFWPFSERSIKDNSLNQNRYWSK